ncbi:hypothetical protein B296_00058483, partial [Ensete ventricosum]
IPPPRHSPSAPLAVPNPARRDGLQNQVRGYNTLEVLLGSPPLTSPSSRTDDAVSQFSDDPSMSPCDGRSRAAKVASSFPGSSGEMMVMKAGIVGGGSNTPKSSWTTASVAAKTRPDISERGAFVGMQNDGAGASKTLKEKTTKAERRALQEAQRAAKAAAKESEEEEKKKKRRRSTSRRLSCPSAVATRGFRSWVLLSPCGETKRLPTRERIR